MPDSGVVLISATVEMRPLHPDATRSVILLVEDNRDIAEMVSAVSP